MCCIIYLCQQHHDAEILDEELRDKILLGAYRFHDFATNSWFVLVERFNRLMQLPTPSEKLVSFLRMLINERTNKKWDTNTSGSAYPSLTNFKSTCPDVYRLLCGTAVFVRTCSNSDFSKRQSM
jgi:hypothetical protein